MQHRLAPPRRHRHRGTVVETSRTGSHPRRHPHTLAVHPSRSHLWPLTATLVSTTSFARSTGRDQCSIRSPLPHASVRSMKRSPLRPDPELTHPGTRPHRERPHTPNRYVSLSAAHTCAPGQDPVPHALPARTTSLVSRETSSCAIAPTRAKPPTISRRGEPPNAIGRTRQLSTPTVVVNPSCSRRDVTITQEQSVHGHARGRALVLDRANADVSASLLATGGGWRLRIPRVRQHDGEYVIATGGSSPSAPHPRRCFT